MEICGLVTEKNEPGLNLPIYIQCYLLPELTLFKRRRAEVFSTRFVSVL